MTKPPEDYSYSLEVNINELDLLFPPFNPLDQFPKYKFDNRSMVEPVPNKPHIAYIKGYWRVSAWKRLNSTAYFEAHSWAFRKNARVKTL